MIFFFFFFSFCPSTMNCQCYKTTSFCFSMHPIASHVKSKKQAQDISKERLSQRLQEMNEQFDVIDQITTNMDRDLQRSNMVSTICMDGMHSVVWYDIICMDGMHSVVWYGTIYMDGMHSVVWYGVV